MHSPEYMEPERRLEVFELSEIDGLVHESKHAFAAPANNPAQTTTELLHAMQSDPAFHIYGYRIDGNAASYIIALSHKDPATLAIGPMYVAEAHRGLGLGHRQVMDFINNAREQGYQNVFTKTWSSNTASRQIFETLGFIQTTIKPADRANGDATISYCLAM